MTLQQQTLLPGQDLKPLTVYRGGSHASRTALQESVKRLLTSVICGRNTGESLVKLNPDGLWLKTYQGYFQAKMDGSFETYSEILPKWGLMLDGQLFLHHGLEPRIDENGYLLLPTPTAEQMSYWESARIMVAGNKRRKSGVKIGTSLSWFMAKWHLLNGGKAEGIPNPSFAEKVMGFPLGWTDGIV